MKFALLFLALMSVSACNHPTGNYPSRTIAPVSTQSPDPTASKG